LDEVSEDDWNVRLRGRSDDEGKDERFTNKQLEILGAFYIFRTLRVVKIWQD